MTVAATLKSFTNSVGYGVRSRLRFSRGAPELRNEDKGRLFDYLDGEARAAAERRLQELERRYNLDALRACSTCADYRDNVYLLHALELLCAGTTLSDRARCVDVGSKNWSYVFALERFWKQRGARDVDLEGIEIDGHGIYPDLRARCDYAQAYARQTGNPNVRYRVADFLDCSVRDLDIVTIFFPFLTRGALLRWGLPLGLYSPERLLRHAATALRPEGWLVLFHQTTTERDRLFQLLAEPTLAATGLRVVRTQSLASDLVHYHEATHDRWGVLLQRV